jgi:uncharacterized protein (DUF1684 family)
MPSPALTATLDLADYRRRVAALYAEVRALDPVTGWQRWCAGRDALFATHPSSPWPTDDARTRIPVFDHDPAWRREVRVRPPTSDEPIGLPHSGDGVTWARPVGEVTVTAPGADDTTAATLTVYWLDQYAGGLFLPFRDATCGDTTYGGGRYLLDGAKSADLGGRGDTLVLDFNLAYHPSCFHDPRWSCPLAPPGNHLPFPVTAGERSG